MRLFVAVNLSDAVKAALIDVQNALLGHGIRGNYTRAENLHLTLAFIGEYPEEQPVLEALSHVAFMPFTLELGELGRFGDLWWMGVRDPVPLTALAHRVRGMLAEAEIPCDRTCFSPHITLIRKAAGEMPEVHTSSGAMTVTGISLMRSERGKNGMIYTAVGTIGAE